MSSDEMDAAIDVRGLTRRFRGARGQPDVEAVRGIDLTVSRGDVFGFLPYWELSDSSAVLNYPTLSTIAYFSVGVDRSGNLVKKNSDGTTSTGWGGSSM